MGQGRQRVGGETASPPPCSFVADQMHNPARGGERRRVGCLGGGGGEQEDREHLIRLLFLRLFSLVYRAVHSLLYAAVVLRNPSSIRALADPHT